MTSEHIKNSDQLFDLVDELRTELTHWRGRIVRSEIEHTIDQLAAAARASLGESNDYAAVWIDVGERALMKFRGMRKLIETITE